MVPEAIFIVKFNTRPQIKYENFHLSAHNLWQGYQIAIIDIPLDRSSQKLCNEVLNDGSESHFHRKIHSAWKKSSKISLKCS